jgi:hypothetical protein
MKVKKYYYISDVNSVSGIEEQGIRADANGDIFIFIIIKEKIQDAVNIAGYIATNQLFLGEYALFEIKEEGITGEITDHKASGRTSQYQKIIKQGIINREHIKFINSYKTSFSI